MTSSPSPAGSNHDLPDDEAAGRSVPASPGSLAIDIDPRSAISFAVAFASIAVGVWFLRSVPRTLTALAIGTLLALALNPLVEALQRRTSRSRRVSATIVLATFGVLFATGIALVTVPTIHQAQHLDRDIPHVVKDLEDLPVAGKWLRKENASEQVTSWLHDLPNRLSVNSKPIARAAGSVADGIAQCFLILLFASALLIDGERLVMATRRLIPASRRPRADRLGALVYEVIGKYIAGSVFVAVLAGIVTLIASLALGVPLAPLIGVWVAMTNLIPQVGGLLGAVPFVLLGTTQGAGTGVACLAIFLVYQNIENHVLQPIIVGRAVSLSPPATMVAALVGVSAGGVVGALFAVPMLGAAKAIYLALRDEGAEPDVGEAQGDRAGSDKGGGGEEAAVDDRGDGVDGRVVVDPEPPRDEQIGEPFEQGHQRRD
jgi:predicted PurR-regulated permease PerM